MTLKNILLFTFVFSSFLARAVDLEEAKRRLMNEGLSVEVHGVVPSQGLVVVAYRNPQNFFDYENFSAVGKSIQVNEELLRLKRHDKIKVKGLILDNKSKQMHIEVAAFELEKPYRSPYEMGEHEYDAVIPDELLNKSSAEFLVHAVHKDGEVLVLEFKDRVIPVFVKAELASQTKNLARNDVVRVHYQVARRPRVPSHLRLASDVPVAVEVLDSVMAKHGKPADITGQLVLFPKSPQVAFDVYAVLEVLPNGLSRQYTLVNFEDQELFKRLRELCANAWSKSPLEYVNGRNKLVHNHLKVRAKGVFNEVDPNQANVQILINDLKDFEILHP